MSRTFAKPLGRGAVALWYVAPSATLWVYTFHRQVTCCWSSSDGWSMTDEVVGMSRMTHLYLLSRIPKHPKEEFCGIGRFCRFLGRTPGTFSMCFAFTHRHPSCRKTKYWCEHHDPKSYRKCETFSCSMVCWQQFVVACHHK